MKGLARWWSEWAAVIGLALSVLVVTGAPYLIGWAASTPERRFEGFVIDVEDAHSHLAKMQEGYRGEWSYHILFTPEPHEGAYLNVFYIGLGHLARLMHLDLVAMYHVTRLVCGFVFLLAAYAFVAMFVPERRERRLAYVLICFSSGLGWLALLLTGSYRIGGITPVDFWLIEMYGFFTVMVFPHTCVALTLLLLSFGLALRYLETGRWTLVAAAALSAVGISLIHAFMVLLVALVLASTWLLAFCRGQTTLRRLPGLMIVWLASLPIVVYQYVALAHNPVFSAWQAQNLTLSPAPWQYVSGYGVVLALALHGAWWALRGSGRWPLLPLWLLIVAPLLYAPSVFPLQRRMIEGAQVPLCILAAIGMERFVLPGLSRLLCRTSLRPESDGRGAPAPRWDPVAPLASSPIEAPAPQPGGSSPRARGVLMMRNLMIGLTLPSTLLVILGAGLAAANGHPDMVHSAAEIAAVDWLAAHSAPGDTVLASYEMGSFIPSRSGQRVFMGHWTETVDLANKRVAAARFYGAASDAERRDLLRRYGIAYVFHGPRERAMGRFDPSSVAYLTLVFNEGDVNVYRVAHHEG